MSKLTAWLTHENAAALMTVLTQRVDGMRRTGELAEEEQLAPEVDPETFTGRRIAGEKHRHLLAVAFGDLVTGTPRRQRGRLAPRHRTARHGDHGPGPVRGRPRRRPHHARHRHPGPARERVGAPDPVRLRPHHRHDPTAGAHRPGRRSMRTRSRTCSSTRRARSSTSVAPNASSHHDCDARSKHATGTAPSPAAAPTSAGATPTTSTSGSTAAAPISTTWSCCACAITTQCTKVAGASPEPPASHREGRRRGSSPRPIDDTGPDQQGARPETPAPGAAGCGTMG